MNTLKFSLLDITVFSMNTVRGFSKMNTVHIKPLVSDFTVENQYSRLNDVIAPLVNIDYDVQLKIKQKWANGIPSIIRNHSPTLGKLRTHVMKIIGSPVLDAYRNKDEFSIYYGVDGNAKTVGFFVGSFKDQVVCIPPRDSKISKEKHIRIAQLYQDFIRQSKLNACLQFDDGGFWRNLIVRSNEAGDTMATVIVHPDGATKSETESVIKDLCDFLDSNEGIDSFHYQSCPRTKCPPDVSPFIHLHGAKRIVERIGKFEFMISPDSFFQVNTPAAERLYSAILDSCDLSSKSTFLDLCCGTGVLSILASELVRGCIGIEVSPSSVSDAHANATLNGVNSCFFFEGSVERKLQPVLNELGLCSGLPVVLNPGRAGINTKGIKVIRKSSKITNLIYVSCKADAATTVKNFVDLLNPKFDQSSPFHLTSLQPVDMFPHTNHCESILVFQR